MRERERQRSEGDVRGPTRGDFSHEEFTDWDNPEDEWEEAPEGYYDDEEEEDEEWEEMSPDHPDYDLSEEAGYAGWEPPERSFFLPQWLIVAMSILLILALLLPALSLFD